MAILVDNGDLWETEEQPDLDAAVEEEEQEAVNPVLDLEVRTAVATYFGKRAVEFYNIHPGEIAALNYMTKKIIKSHTKNLEQSHRSALMSDFANVNLDALVKDDTEPWIEGVDYYLNPIEVCERNLKSKNDAESALRELDRLRQTGYRLASRRGNIIRELSSLVEKGIEIYIKEIEAAFWNEFPEKKSYLAFIDDEKNFFRGLNKVIDVAYREIVPERMSEEIDILRNEAYRKGVLRVHLGNIYQ